MRIAGDTCIATDGLAGCNWYVGDGCAHPACVEDPEPADPLARRASCPFGACELLVSIDWVNRVRTRGLGGADDRWHKRPDVPVPVVTQKPVCRQAEEEEA